MEESEYRKLAQVEDRMWYFRGLHGLAERALGGALGAAAQILDAGCGTGGLIRRLGPAHPGWAWTGIDLSPVACALARERTTADIRLGSVTELPFGERSFDAVVSCDVLYHVEDDGAALREAARVLRPGGRLRLGVPDTGMVLDAYARGVNLFIAQHQATLPPEFKLLGYRPQSWSGVDSVSIGLTIVQMLDTHWDAKLSREAIAAKLNDPKLEADLYPVGSWRDHPPTGLITNPSQTHPKPAKTISDDEDRSQASAAAPSASLPRKSANSLTR